MRSLRLKIDHNLLVKPDTKLADVREVYSHGQAIKGTTDARGLSMLVYDKRDGGVKVRRIENKMGIKGSPTCELYSYFDGI